jgi:hypothetical protein
VDPKSASPKFRNFRLGFHGTEVLSHPSWLPVCRSIHFATRTQIRRSISVSACGNPQNRSLVSPRFWHPQDRNLVSSSTLALASTEPKSCIFIGRRFAVNRSWWSISHRFRRSG